MKNICLIIAVLGFCNAPLTYTFRQPVISVRNSLLIIWLKVFGNESSRGRKINLKAANRRPKQISSGRCPWQFRNSRTQTENVQNDYYWRWLVGSSFWSQENPIVSVGSVLKVTVQENSNVEQHQTLSKTNRECWKWLLLNMSCGSSFWLQEESNFRSILKVTARGSSNMEQHQTFSYCFLNHEDVA